MNKTTTQMELVDIDKLIPYINNARTHSPEQISKLRASLREFGFINPVIIDKDFNIIAGHGRVIAAKAESIEKVPCVLVDYLSEAQKKAYILADNRMALDAGWDEELLKVEIESLQAENFDVSLTGFEDAEISDLFDSGTETKDDDYDPDEDLPETPFSQKGDIYILGNHRLMCGDSTDKETVNKLVDGIAIDMIFTDPPYNVDYEGSTGMKIQNDKQEDGDFYNFLLKAFTNMANVIKPGGSIYCCHADTEGLNFRTAFKNAGFKLAECLVWVKNSLVLGRQDYHWRHEPILYGWKEGAGHYFVNDRTQDTVWEYNKPKTNDLHPTMKPIELVAKAIKNSSKKNDSVLDLFGGSGSTLIACEQIQRKSYLMELDERYTDVIVKRYLRFVNSNKNCFLIRNGENIPLSNIEQFKIDDDSFLE